MSSYKKKEVMDYLTRKPVTTQDIELARTRIQTPVTPAPMQVTSGEGPETDYQTEVAPEMVVPPQDVLPKNAEPVMPSAPGIPNPEFRQIELATGGRVNFNEGSKLTGTGKTLEQNIKDDHKAFNDYRKSIGQPTIPLDNAFIRMWQRTRLSEGGRADFQLGGSALGRILGKTALSSEKEYSALKKFIIDTYSVNKDDPNLFPAIQKYSEKFGGNLSNTAENLGLDRKAMIQAGERRGFKFEGKGSTGTTKIKDLDYGDLTAAELTNLVKENPNYLKQLIKDKKINPNEFYNAGDIAKIFGLSSKKEYRDNIIRDFAVQKTKTYDKGRFTNEPVEIVNDPQREQFKLYKLNDIINNIEKDAAFKTKAPVSGNLTDLPKIRKELDPELDTLLNNFKVKKNIIISKESDPALTEALVNNPKTGTEGIFFDYGHAFAIDNYRNFDFAKKNSDKIYSLNRSVIQDPYINRTILVDTQGQEKNLFSNIDQFFKKYKGKAFDEEAIARAEAINQEANDLFGKRQSRIKEFVNERSKTEPYLKGQENTLSNIHIDIKPGKKISDTDIKIFGDIDPRHSFGNIKNINPNANYFSDLTKEQKEMFKQNMVDQNINYSKSVLKQSNFDPVTIKDFEESMLFGPTAEKEGFINESGVPKFNKGGRVKLANGTEEPYNPEIPSLGFSDPIDILEQQMINEKDPTKILALDFKLTQMKKRQAEKQKTAEEEKIAQKEKGVRYKEDFPSEADYFIETGKQLLTNPKYFYGKLGKGVVEGTEWLVGQPIQTLFSQEGKNWEFYQPVAGEKLGINKFIEENKPEFPTTGTLFAGDVAEVAGSIFDPFLAYGIVKGVTKASKTETPVVIDETVDPTKRDLLKMGAVLTGGAIAYPTAKKLGLLDNAITASRVGKGVRIATNPVVNNMPEFFPYLSEFSLRKGISKGDYMRSGMTEFKRELNLPLEIQGKKTNVKLEFIHNPAEGNVTAYYTNPLTDEKFAFDYYAGKQGRQAYGIDPKHPGAWEYHAVEVEPPGFYYKGPDKSDPYRKTFDYFDTSTEGDEVIEALDKWYKGLSKEEKATFENKFITHTEYTDEIGPASWSEEENYPIMDFMYPKKKND